MKFTKVHTAYDVDPGDDGVTVLLAYEDQAADWFDHLWYNLEEIDGVNNVDYDVLSPYIHVEIEARRDTERLRLRIAAKIRVYIKRARRLMKKAKK